MCELQYHHVLSKALLCYQQYCYMLITVSQRAINGIAVWPTVLLCADYSITV